MIYLDHAATTPILGVVQKAMQNGMEEYFGNASALHTPGHQSHEEIEECRNRLAHIINAKPSEIIFTASSTESNNTVINIFRDQNIATSTIDHESIIEPAKALAKVYTPVEIDKNGKVCYNEKIRQSQPKLVSIIYASNELGVIQDIKTLAKAAHQTGALFHSDMTQALGKIPIDVADLDVDYATFSAHKIGGPVGVSALYVKTGSPFKPFLIGGSQENRRRASTYNTIGIIGFNAALKYLEENSTPELYQKQVKPLRDKLARRILAEIEGSNLNSNLDENTLPNILNVSFAAAEGESIQLYLDAEEIIVSTGSACAAGTGKPSHVLMAKTGDAEVAHSSIRFSFGLDNTADDIDKVMQVLPNIIKKLQGMSTIQYERK